MELYLRPRPFLWAGAGTPHPAHHNVPSASRLSDHPARSFTQKFGRKVNESCTCAFFRAGSRRAASHLRRLALSVRGSQPPKMSESVEAAPAGKLNPNNQPGNMTQSTPAEHPVFRRPPVGGVCRAVFRAFIHTPRKGINRGSNGNFFPEPCAPVADIPSANPLIGPSCCTLSGGGTSFFTEIVDQTIYIYRSLLFKCDWFLRRTGLCGGASGIRKNLTTSLSSPIHARRQPWIQKGSNVTQKTTAAVVACIGDTLFRPQGRNFHPSLSNNPAEMHSEGAGRLRHTRLCGAVSEHFTAFSRTGRRLLQSGKCYIVVI